MIISVCISVPYFSYIMLLICLFILCRYNYTIALICQYHNSNAYQVHVHVAMHYLSLEFVNTYPV